MDCDQVRELIEAYVLEALDPDEQASVTAHLTDCPDCQRLVRDAADAVVLLPQALGAVSPLRVPAAVKMRLLQSIQALPVSPPVAAAPPLTIAPDRPVPLNETKRRSHATNRPWWPRVRAAGVVALIVILCAVLIWSARLNSALAQESALRAMLSDQVGQQEIVLDVVDSTKTVRAVLRAVSSDSKAYGKIFIRPDMPYVVSMIARLPQPPAGQVYHLWTTSQGQVQLLGTMTVNKDGFGLLVYKADHNGPVYDAARLRLDPEGSTTPSGPLVLQWDASQ